MKNLLKGLSPSGIMGLTTFFDRLLFVSLIVISVAGFFFAGDLFPAGSIVKVSVDNRDVYRLSLDEDRIVAVEGPLGKSLIEVKNKKVHMMNSPCPRKLCVHEGWKDRGSIVCLPNKVVVTVSGMKNDEQYDAVSK